MLKRKKILWTAVLENEVRLAWVETSLVSDLHTLISFCLRAFFTDGWKLKKNFIFLFFYFSHSHFFIWYFLHLHFKCYLESLLNPFPALLPYPPTPTSWPWHSPLLRHIKFVQPMGISFHWWPTRPSSDSYAARDTSSGWGWRGIG